MSALAYRLAKVAAWALPAFLVLTALFAFTKGQVSVGVSLLGAGTAGLVWDFLFLPASTLQGQAKVLRPEAVLYEDAPLGFLLFHLLPVLGAALLAAAIALLLTRSSP